MDNISYEAEAIKSLRRRAISLVKAKRLQEAVAVLNEIVQLDPRNFLAYFQLAQIYFAGKKFDGAEYMCQQAIISNPQDIRPWQILGNIYVSTNNFDKVVSQLPVALSVDPDYFQLNYLVGYGFARKGHIKKAKEYLDKASKIDPNNKKLIQAMTVVNQALAKLKRKP